MNALSTSYVPLKAAQAQATAGPEREGAPTREAFSGEQTPPQDEGGFDGDAPTAILIEASTGSACRSLKRTSPTNSFVSDVNPRFGKRRCSGI